MKTISMGYEEYVSDLQTTRIKAAHEMNRAWLDNLKLSKSNPKELVTMLFDSGFNDAEVKTICEILNIEDALKEYLDE